MGYVGGKCTGYKHIIEVLNSPQYNGMDYIEPFVGYGYITMRIKNKKSITINDYNGLLVCLLDGIRQNLPYPAITRERYNELKKMDGVITWERAIAGFSYSYCGKLWGGYILDNSQSPSYNDPSKKCYGKLQTYYKQHQKHYEKLKKNPVFMTSTLTWKSYDELLSPEGLKPTNCLIYCDPPYQNTTGYYKKSVGVFDHDKFWNWVREMSRDNVVFVSEYTAPDDFECIAELPKKSTLSGKRIQKLEKLFKLKI